MGITALCARTQNLFNAVAVLGYLYLRRDAEIEGTMLAFPTLALPGILAALIVFSLVAGPASALAMEREDGTLLRAKCVPHGITGYVAGQIVLHTLSLVPMLLVIMVASAILFDVFAGADLHDWVTFAWVVVLGLLATLPLGIIIGSLVPNVQKAGTWGFLPVVGAAMISGIFFPMDSLWGWPRSGSTDGDWATQLSLCRRPPLELERRACSGSG